MKTQDIQRGIISRHARANGDAAAIGEVSRVRDPKSATENSRRSHSDGSNAIFLWSTALSLVTIVIIGLAFYLWVLPRFSTPVTLADEETNAEHEARVRVASRFPSPSSDQALDFVKRAIQNRDPSKMESFFRLGDSTPSEALEFLENSLKTEGEVESYEWLSSIDVRRELIDGVLLTYPSKQKTVERLALLTPDSYGNWKLDFDAFARTAKPSWDELLENRAKQAMVRVIVGRDSYFNGSYTDEGKWASYAIVSPDTEILLHGYCKVGSSEAEAMEKMFSQDRKLCRATLEIRHTKESEERQYEITRVFAEDWVVPDRPGGNS